MSFRTICTALLPAALLLLAGCNHGRDPLDYGRAAIEFGRGPFDGERAVTDNPSVFDGLHESSWDAATGDGAVGRGGVLFVANKRGDSVSQIDLASGRIERTVPACKEPHELALSRDGRHFAIACYGGTGIVILATAGLVRVTNIELGEGAKPHGLEWHSGGDLFVTAEGRGSLVRIAQPLGAARLTEYPTGGEISHMVALAPDLSAAWTADIGSDTVTRIDLAGGQPPLSASVGVQPEGIALSPDNVTLWVSARGSDQVFALDPATLAERRTLTVGDFPLRLAVRPQGDVAVTSNLADGSLTVIDLERRRVARTIRVAGREAAEQRQQVTVLWSADGKRIYVAETGSDTIAEIDYASATLLRRLPAGPGGDGLALLEQAPR